MRRVRFGFKLPFYPPELVFSSVAEAEELRLDSAWSADHLVAISTKSPECLSSWGILSAIAGRTRHMLLGSSVTDPCRFHPAVVAQMAMTLHKMTNGTFILGVGAGEAQNTSPYGIDCSRPASRLAEFVEVVKELLSGKEVTHQGDFYKLKKAAIKPSVPDGGVKIWLGANSPRTIRMVGELADGWLPLGVVFSPASYKSSMLTISQVAIKRGRDPDSIEPALFVHVAIAKTHEEASKMAETPGKLQLLGWTPEAFKDLDDATRERFHFKSLVFNQATTGELEGILKHLPVEPVYERTVVGTPEQCVEKFRAYVDAGVRHFVASLMCPSDKLAESLRLYGEVAAHFRKN